MNDTSPSHRTHHHFSTPPLPVLLLWNDAGQISTLESQVRRLSDSVGADVCVENADRLLLSAHAASKFDACLSSSTPPHSFFHSDEILAEIAKVLKPNGRLTLTVSSMEREQRQRKTLDGVGKEGKRLIKRNKEKI